MIHPVLYRCEPLNASITRAQCERNRTRGKGGRFTQDLVIFACESCGGLGVDEVKIDLGGIEMSKPVRGNCPACKREDVLLTSSNGECHRCYKRRALGLDVCADQYKPGKKPSKAPAKAIVVREELLKVVDVAPTGEFVSEPIQPVDAPGADFGLVQNGDGNLVQFGVDPLVVMALNEALGELQQAWLVTLSGLSPCRTLSLAHSMVETVRGLRC